jgi:ABC-type oligopeptide transport system ATPase subunit
MVCITGLKKSFIAQSPSHGRIKAVMAVDGVSFEIPGGRIAALVGESGSGKTTIARCICGLETPDSGEILYNGAPLVFDTKDKRRMVQYIFQDTFSSLNPRMKTGEILGEPLIFHFNLRGGALEEEKILLLGSVGLSGAVLDKYPHELSGGQRQRVVIARALSMRPGLLLADEPVSSLDVSVQAQVLSLLKELNEARGLSILFITHDLRVVKSLAHDVIVLKEGKIVEKGKVEDVFLRPGQDYTKLLLSCVPGAAPGPGA